MLRRAVLTVFFAIAGAASLWAESPFCIHEAHVGNPVDNAALADLGVSEVRLPPEAGFVWDIVERQKAKYDWSVSDKVILELNQKGIRVFATILAQNKLDYPEGGPGKPHPLPRDLGWFLEFVRQVAERYDGDGINDAPGSPKVATLQIENEPDSDLVWNDTPQNFARLIKESGKMIKKVAPGINVAVGGMATPDGFNRFYKPFLQELQKLHNVPEERYFDIFDVHWSAQFRGDYRAIDLPRGVFNLKELVRDIKNECRERGCGEIAVYITEMSSYSGKPVEQMYVFKSEKEQAVDLLRRYIYALASGVSKIFWTRIEDGWRWCGPPNGYWDNVGLIHNPLNSNKSHKKLAYFAYRKMVDILEGSDWNNIEMIQESVGIYIYKFTRAGKPIWAAWNDNVEKQEISVAGITSGRAMVTEAVPRFDSGKDVADYGAAFSIQTAQVNEARATVIIKDSPVYITEE